MCGRRQATITGWDPNILPLPPSAFCLNALTPVQRRLALHPAHEAEAQPRYDVIVAQVGGRITALHHNSNDINELVH
jgi:hypothetical protein